MKFGSQEWYDANPTAPDATEIAEIEDEMLLQRRLIVGERKDWTTEDWRKEWEKNNQKSIDAGYGPLPF